MRLAWIHFVDQDGPNVDNSLPSGPGFPGGGPIFSGRPDNSLPKPPGSIGTLPVFPFDPTTGPDNSLPGPQPTPTPPIQLHPGLRLVVKYMACVGFIAVPDNSLPETPEPK
jgi:hypothetical protein